PLTMSIAPGQTLAQAEQMLTQNNETYISVIDASGKLMGTLTQAEIQQIPLEDRSIQTVETVMQRDVLTITPDEALDKVLEQLTAHRVNWAPVLDLDDDNVAGTISTTQIMRAYRQTLTKDAKRMRGLTQGTVMLEVEIRAEMPLAGKTLRDAHLPNESLVISIRHQNEQIFPRGGTTIQAGDVVTFMVSPAGEERLQTYLKVPENAPTPV
ncbi:MAG: TrkA C-terminal domain-containing protein, partial [Ktedonobacteraceae bacterium]